MDNGLLILGNGFDLDLGMNTRYSDFWDSEGWKNAKMTCPEKYLVTSLEKYRITHNWFDLESGLQDGATRLLNRLGNSYTGREYYESYQILINKLKEYILNQQEVFVPKDNSVAEQLLKVISVSTSIKCIYSFNYTDVNKISERFQIANLPPVYHIHGSLKPNDQIILGVEVEDFSLIPTQLTFLIKSNSPYYQYNSLLRNLDSADNVIFFGHSINGMDFPYFKSYFMDLSTLPINMLENKHITIITYDEYSAMEIKDNFRRNGIDVRNLFNKVAMNFIMTKGVYEGKESEIAKLEVLKNEIIEGIEGGD